MTRVERAAAAAVQRAAQRVADGLAAEPGVSVRREGATVTAEGRGVLARLRWLGGYR